MKIKTKVTVITKSFSDTIVADDLDLKNGGFVVITYDCQRKKMILSREEVISIYMEAINDDDKFAI